MAMESDELQQHKSWNSAQSIAFRVDLIAAAKAQLRFLAAVDRHPCLYEGPAVKRAVHRYENCWLPLLAEHGPYINAGIPLIPPLDCSWIWHCHRLNPVQYIKDCESHYGKLLDAPLITDDADEAANSTKLLWDCLYPQEKYDLNFKEYDNVVLGESKDTTLDSISPQNQEFEVLAAKGGSRKIMYDLEAAVARQRSFYYQVARIHMSDERFLKVALQRYKGFLYLLKLSNLKVFMVPTYDIDLIWHSHQRIPKAYREDMVQLLGRVLNHDDTDSDRSEGKKLDTGFNQTYEYWQRTFGVLYKRAGAMYRGEPPRPLQPFLPKQEFSLEAPTIVDQQDMGLRVRNTIQVFLTVLGARNVRIRYNGTLAVRLLFHKKCSALRSETPWVTATSDPIWKCFWGFESETSTEGVRLELLHQISTCFDLLTRRKLIGFVDISWQKLFDSPTLSLDGWVPLIMKSGTHGFKPVSLRVSISVTPPVTSPYLFRIKNSLHTDNQGQNISNGRPGCWLTRTVFDHANTKAFIISTPRFDEGKSNPCLIQVHQASGGHISDKVLSNKGIVHGKFMGCAKQLFESGETTSHTRRQWSLLENAAHLVVTKNLGNIKLDLQPHVHLTAKLGYPVRLVCGRKLQYEVLGATEDDEAGFITLIRYSPNAPSGKATALFNWISGAMEVSSEENVILVILLSSAIAASVLQMQNPKKMDKKRRKLKRARTVPSSDEWGSVIFDRERTLHSNSMSPYSPWYSMSSLAWISTMYSLGTGCGGGCGGSGCGGCGNGAEVGNSRGQQGGCGGECGGCGTD